MYICAARTRFKCLWSGPAGRISCGLAALLFPDLVYMTNTSACPTLFTLVPLPGVPCLPKFSNFTHREYRELFVVGIFQSSGRSVAGRFDKIAAPKEQLMATAN